VAVLSFFTALAAAQDKVGEAAPHFRRGVDLYNENDFAGALVEFKRAYAIAPSVNLLYNIGQTEYQMQAYADALSAFEDYLRQGGGTHKAEIESAIAVLRTRVGRVRVVTDAPGADVLVDDRSIGKAPLNDSVTVSVGRRKISVNAPDRPPATKWVDVASGDEAVLTINLGPASEPALPRPPPVHTVLVTPEARDSSHPPVAAWVITGALAVGTAVAGGLAIYSEGRLNDARNTFPGDKGEIDGRASTTRALAVTADVLGAATIVAAGLSMYWTFWSSPSSEGRAAIGPRGVVFSGSF
jgi:hypothetical protein